METQPKKKQENRFGLSKKTNIAIAAIAALVTAAQSNPALIAIVVVTLVALTYQFILDIRKEKL